MVSESRTDTELSVVPLRVVIVGAGLAGLSTAISLGRRGHSVLVLESTKELQAIGAGVALTPSAKDFYDSENVLSPDASVWCSSEGFEARGWGTGAVVARTEFPAEKRLTTILHGDLQQALISRAHTLNDVTIRLGSRVVDIGTNGPEIILASGERIGGDLIILADGVNSKLKWKVCPSELETAEFTGYAAYRLVLPRKLLESDQDLLALLQSNWMKRWDGPQGHIIAYPIHNREVLNVVLHHPDKEAEESWTSTTAKQHVAAAFESWDPVLRKLINLAPAEVPNFRIFTHSPSPAWVKDSVILLGDACHAMPPYLAQGVAQAVEDSLSITTVLSMMQDKQELAVALEAYETCRKGRVLEIQAGTVKARELAFRKENEMKEARNEEREIASEAKHISDVVKMMQSTWAYDPLEVARLAMLEGRARFQRLRA